MWWPFAGITTSNFGVDAIDVGLLFRLVHHHQFVFLQLPCDGSPEVMEQEYDGRDGEDHADGIEDGDRCAGRGCPDVPVDQRLLPTTAQQEPGCEEHQHMGDDNAEPLSPDRESADENVRSQV